MSDSLRPHGPQHTRLACPSTTPRTCSNSCPSSWWCLLTILSSVVSFSHLQSFLASGSFPVSQFFTSGGQSIGVSASASVRPSNEYSGLISFRMDWLDFLAVQGPLKSLLQHHSSKASILWPSAFFMVQLSHPYMTTGKTISSVQSLSRVRLCDPVDCSRPGVPVHHQLPEFTQTHVHWVGDAIQPSHPLLAFAPLHFVLQGQTCLLLQGFLDFLLLHSSPLWWKGHLFFFFWC